MNSSTRKVIVGALSVAMALTPFAGVFVASASAASYTFSTNLTVGSTGPDVTALQSILNAGGFLQVQPTGYFGSLTQAALAAWQSSVGISPAVGYFGPISRAYLNNMSGTMTGTTSACPAGYTCMPVSTAPVVCPAGYTCTSTAPTTGTVTAGCAAGASYSSTTGQPCTTTAPSNQQGVLTLTLAGSPASQGNIQTNTDVPVWGLQVQSQLGDVTINKLDLDVADTVNASPSRTENPGNFINNVKVWDGSTILLNRNVGLNDFIQNPNNVSDFYISLQNFSFVVPNGSTKTLVVSVSTNGGIDTSRTLTFQGYSGESNNLTATSQGVYQFYNVNGSGYTRTQTFQRPGNATVSFGIDASNPVSSTIYDDVNAGVSAVPVFAFNGISTNGATTVKTVTLNIHSTGAQPSTVYLYDSTTGQNLNSVSIPTGSTTATAIFNNLNDTIASGATNVYTVKFDYSGTGASTQSVITASTTLASVQYQQSNGSITTATPNIVGNDQYFYNATPNLAFVSGSASTGGTNTNGSTTSMTGTFVLRVTPQGGSEAQPVASDFVLKYGTSLGGAVTTGVTNTLTISPQPAGTNPLSTGGQYTLTVTGTVFNASVAASGAYTWYLTSASTSVLDVTGLSHAITQTWGLSNYYTNPVTFVK